MGYVKIVKLAPGKVKAVHQLDAEGTAYAEDVTFESNVAGRLGYLEQQDGKIGTLSYGFTPIEPQPEGLKFPGDERTTAPDTTTTGAPGEPTAKEEVSG